VTRIVWSPRALHELEMIRDYIPHDSALYAGLVVQPIVASVERLPRTATPPPRVAPTRRLRGRLRFGGPNGCSGRARS